VVTREEKTRVSQVSRIADKRLAGGIPCFVQIYGKDIGRKYPLDKVQTTIGRGPDNGIVCDMEQTCRRTHCKIYAGAGGQLHRRTWARTTARSATTRS